MFIRRFLRKKSTNQSTTVFGNAIFNTTASSKEVLFDHERQARRDAYVKAAEERQKSWDKKLATARKQKKMQVEEQKKFEDQSTLSEATLKSIEQTKQYERKVVQVLLSCI